MANSNEYMKTYMLNRYYRRREDAIKYLGSKCSVCASQEDLEIDHIDYEAKSFSIGKALSGWAWSRVVVELDKCQLLCKDHHSEKTRKDLAKRFNQREHWEHGTLSGYRHCKCDECRLANREYSRKYRMRVKDKPL